MFQLAQNPCARRLGERSARRTRLRCGVSLPPAGGPSTKYSKGGANMTNRQVRCFGFLVGAVLMFAACGGDNGGGTGGNGSGGGSGGGGGGGSADMTMPKSGACTDANDTAIGKPAMDAAASACGLPCYADKDANPPKMCADC